MSFTAKDVSDGVKCVLTNTTYQTNIYTWLNVALKMFPSIREDAMIDSTGERVTLPSVTGDADVIPLDGKFLGCFIDYCIGRGFQEDGEDGKHRERANDHLQAFFDIVKAV